MGRIGQRSATALLATALAVAGCSSATDGSAGRKAGPSSPARSTSAVAPATSSVPATPARPSTTAPTRSPATATRPPALRTHAQAARTSAPARSLSAARLPLRLRTGTATQVITVTAGSTRSTQATLQAWRKVTGGWRKVGGAVHAWVGSAGLSAHTSESVSATPIGSFTLTQAFGRDANPGTALPYRHTTPADWWISQAGPLYNTLQHCSSGCGFTRGDPNEHLYYETPYYDYAVVIDANTSNAPGGVRQGAGSAFFLHVTVGEPTAGCVAVPQAQVIRLLRWLTPAAHPRILIGVP